MQKVLKLALFLVLASNCYGQAVIVSSSGACAGGQPPLYNASTSRFDCGDVASTVSYGSGLLSGGRPAWAGNLNFIVPPATYMIAGNIYSSLLSSITLDAADPTNPRIDVIAVDDTGTVVKITGTPAAAPAKPGVDATSQWELTFITIAAGATVPSNVSQDDVYLENVEWTCAESSPIGTFNCASTTNPYAGTKDIEATTVGRNDYVQLTRASSIILSNYNNLVFYVRSKAAWATQRSLVISAQLSGAIVGSSVVLNSGAFGFDSSNTSAYQLIVIPTSAFGAAGTIDRLRFTVSGGGSSTIGFYLDNILLQGGVVPQIPAQPYDLVFSVPGTPDDGRVFPVITFTRPVSFGGNFAGSRGTVGTNPTAQQTFTVSKNAAAVGTVVVSTAGVVTFTTIGAAPVSFIGGGRMTITAPTPQDATLADVAFTISGVR